MSLIDPCGSFTGLCDGRSKRGQSLMVRIDPLDQTALTYMDSGEVIPCDLVVLKDAEGNVITVT